jgi:hypothetical protein
MEEAGSGVLRPNEREARQRATLQARRESTCYSLVNKRLTAGVKGSTVLLMRLCNVLPHHGVMGARLT